MPKYDNESDGLGHLLDTMMGEKHSIEKSEARGQQALVESDDLPRDVGRLSFKEITENTGIIFGEPINDLFIEAKLPKGWSKQRTDHSMWSNLVDDKGRERAGIFYKAAFYDRKAHMHFNRFYNISTDYGGDEATEIKDGNGTMLKRFERAEDDEFGRKADDSAGAWLAENYPNWENPWAYWA